MFGVYSPYSNQSYLMGRGDVAVCWGFPYEPPTVAFSTFPKFGRNPSISENNPPFPAADAPFQWHFTSKSHEFRCKASDLSGRWRRILVGFHPVLKSKSQNTTLSVCESGEMWIVSVIGVFCVCRGLVGIWCASKIGDTLT